MLTAIVSVLYYLVTLVWVTAYFLFVCVIFAVTAPFDRERVVLHAASRVLARSIVWLNPLWSIRVTGKENIDRKAKYVITVNHQSMIDIPLMYVIPSLNFKWVSKDFVYKIPFVGAMLWMHGDIVIKSGSLKTTREFMVKGRRRLAAGTSVILFPEGTRSHDGEIHRFKDGAAILARDAGVGILPCVINGGKGYMEGWKVRRTRFEIAIMPPITAEEIANSETAVITHRIHDMSIEKLAQLRISNPKPDRFNHIARKQNEEDAKERRERLMREQK